MAWWQFWNKSLVGKTLGGGRYYIKQKLGSGGFGDAYLAIKMLAPNKKQQSVIKHFKLKFQSDSSTLKKLIAKFEEEKEILERLGQKNRQIPRLLDGFTQDNQLFSVQEFVDGHTLDHEMKSPLSECEVRQMLIDILDVMSFVHDENIIHRDLTPANIMRRKADEKIVIIDFGAFKEFQIIAVKNQEPNSSVVICTEGYAPAEQLVGKPLFASDVYAIGMIGIQALTGTQPKFIPHINLEVDWKPTPAITPEFVAIIKRMVRYDFKQRYPNAREALLALKNMPPLPRHKSPHPPIHETITHISPVTSKPPSQTSRDVSGKLSSQVPKEETDVIRAGDRSSTTNPFKVTGGLLLLALICSGVYAWQNPKLLSFLPSSTSAATPSNSTTSNTNPFSSNAALSGSDTEAAAAILKAREKYNKKDSQGAIADLNEAIRLKPDFSLAYLLRGATKANSLEDHQSAISDYNEAIKINRNWGDRSLAEAYSARGYSKEKLGQGDWQGVIADNSEAIRLKPDYASAYFNRGNARKKLGDKLGAKKEYLAAIDDYSEAIRLKDSEIHQAYMGRSSAKAAIKDYQGALADINECIRLKPDYVEAYISRGVTKGDLGDKQGEIADYTEAIRLKPDSAYAYSYRGSTKVNLKDYQGAISDVNEAIKINANWGDSSLARAYDDRGFAKMSLGNYLGAIVDFNESIRLKPDDNSYNNRGSAKYNLGEKQGALADYSEAIRLKPDSALAYNNRGQTSKDLGDKQGAIADYTEAARLYQQQGEMDNYLQVLNDLKQLEK